MTPRPTAAALLAASALVALVGCAAAEPDAESTVQVVYTLDGAEQTAVLAPDTVDCDDTGANGISLGNDPQGSFAFRVDSDGAGRATVGVQTSKGLVVFESDDVDVQLGDGTVTVAASDGAALIAEDWQPGDDTDIDPADATSVDATVSAELRCDAN